MKRIISSLAIITAMVVFLLPDFTNAQPQEKPEWDKYSYIGVKKCGMCHKKDKDGNQLKVWEDSKHSKAFETLKSDEANKIAKELGHGDVAADAPACLKCHVPQFEVADARLEKDFNKEDGVQCESCHGPGSEYKSMKIMKDHQAAVENGMRDFTNKEDIKAFCETCHNDESPTFKGFEFEKMWEKIQHPIPAEG